MAGWLEFTGEPLAPGEAAEAVAEEQLAEQQAEERWHVGPAQGALVLLFYLAAKGRGPRGGKEACRAQRDG